MPIPNKPVRDYPFPSVVVDTTLAEFSSTYVGDWGPIEPGTPFAAPDTHSEAETALYAGSIFLGQRIGKDQEHQERLWGTVPHTQDIYNYSLEFAKKTTSAPTFKRRYLILRDSYAALTTGSAFTGLYAIAITNGGAGYNAANPPVVACTGGAVALAIVDPSNGSIVKITLKIEGASCTNVVTIDAPPVGGTQATALGILQPAGCVLVDESAEQAPSPWDSLYLLVSRTYMTLPGPTVNSTRPNFDGTVTNIATTAKLIGDIHPGEALIDGNTVWQVTSLKEADSTYWAYEVVETRPATSNPAVPFDKLDELDEVPVFGTRTLDLIDNITPLVEESSDGTNWTRTYLEPMESHLVALKITETRLIVGPVVAEEGQPDFDQLTLNTTRQLVAVGSIVEGESISGSNWLRKFGKQHMGSSYVALQFIVSRPATGNIVDNNHPDSDGVTIFGTKQLLPAGSISNTESISGSTWNREYGQEHEGSTLVRLQLIEGRALDAANQPFDKLDPLDNAPVTGTRTLRNKSSIVTEESSDGTTWTRTYGESREGSSLVQWQISEARPATGNIITTTDLREAAEKVTTTTQLLPLGSIVTEEQIVGSNWVRKFLRPHEGSTYVGLQIVESQPDTGNTQEATTPDSDGVRFLVNTTLKQVGAISYGESFSNPTWTGIDIDPLANSVLMARQVSKTRNLPGPVVIEIAEHGPTGLPILISRRIISSGTPYITGEFVPAAITVNAISTGATVTVTLASNHDLPPMAWVNFAGTTCTPNINGWQQIIGIPEENQILIAPASSVTVAQSSPAGTMQAINRITREIRPISGSAIMAIKMDSMLALPTIPYPFEDILCEEPYAYPDFLPQEIPFYAEAAASSSTGSGISGSKSWGGAIGLPIQAGYRGPSVCRRKRFIFMGPPPDSFASQFTPTMIAPSKGTFAIEGGSVGFSFSSSGGIGGSESNNWRTGAIPPVLTDADPHTVPGDLSNIGPFTITAIGTDPIIPKITTSTANGLQAGWTVQISGSNSTPHVDGFFTVADIVSPTQFQIQPGFAVTGAGTSGSVLIHSTGQAIAKLDLPVSVPPKLVAKLNISSIGTGATPTLTLSGPHYLQLGQYVLLSSTGTTPSLDGFWPVTGIPNPNQIEVTPPASITGGSSGVGQMQSIITMVEPPQKLGVAGLWQCYVKFIFVLYTSGESP